MKANIYRSAVSIALFLVFTASAAAQDLTPKFDEAEIRLRCRHTSVGMRLNRIAGGLSDLPIVVEHSIDWGLDDLSDCIRAETHPIVAVDLRPIDGVFAFHAVVGIEQNQLLVHDPLYQSGLRSIGLSAFETGWASADREAVLITSK